MLNALNQYLMFQKEALKHGLQQQQHYFLPTEVRGLWDPNEPVPHLKVRQVGGGEGCLGADGMAGRQWMSLQAH